MTEDIERLLNAHGDDAVITDSKGSHREKVFIEPRAMSFAADEKYIPTHLGIAETGDYLCIMRGGFDFDGVKRSVLTYCGSEYRFVNAALFRVERENSHWEFILRKREELYDDGN